MYRTVKELNNNELDELRNSLYWQELSKSGIGEEAITNTMLFEHYDGINFVEDDFFCNQ